MGNLEEFFSLKRFAHRSLWKEGEPVWFPLKILDLYLQEQVLGKIDIEIPDGVVLVQPELISIGEGTVLEPGVVIQGPCILGKGCIVRHGALLRDGVICGDGCAIRHCAEVKHSILLDGACASHFSYVGDSIVGRDVNLGAGAKCANVRLDQSDVVVKWRDERTATGLRKMGAIIGDGVQIGCNCVLNPGALIGRESVCYPLLNFSGYAPPKSTIRGETRIVVEQADAVEILKRIGK
jgi:NDP-sugar pyrophosphorylase family protein